MTDKIGEQLSAWMDGELPDEEAPLLLKRLEEDRGLRFRLQRYHLIRDALKGALPEMINYRMAEQVDREIQDLPSGEVGEPAVAPLGVQAGQRWLKPLAGVAIAASVAVVAILGVRLLNTSEQQGPPVAQIAGSSLPAGVQTVADNPAPPQIYRAGQTIGWTVSDPEVRQRLNDYLVNHSEYASSTGMQGMPPRVRIVGYDSGE